MRTFDAAPLSTSINALAETFDRKTLTPKALEIWFDSLKEFPTDMILGLLKSWPKAHGKFPTPAEIWAIANNIQIAERDRAAAQLQAQAKQEVRFERTEAGSRAMAEIRKLARHRKPTAFAHWKSVLEKSTPDTIAYRYAAQAIAMLGHKYRMRQPGDDDEEIAVQ